MKDGVRIVNCARGGCVDTNALAAALKAAKWPEPPLTYTPKNR